MARLRIVHVSTVHLLCLMEIWFDRTQPIVDALAAFSYTWAGDGKVGCPFCRTWYDSEESQLTRQRDFDGASPVERVGGGAPGGACGGSDRRRPRADAGRPGAPR